MLIRLMIIIAIVSIGTNLLSQPQCELLANGMNIVIQETPQSPLSSLELRLTCGVADEYSSAAGKNLSDSGLRRVLLLSLLAASAEGNWQNIVKKIAGQGGQITTRMTPDALVISVAVPTDKEQLALATLAAIIIRPYLSDEIINAAINQLKNEQAYLFHSRLDAAEARVNSLIYPVELFNSTASYGSPAGIKKLTPDLVRTFAQAMAVPEKTILSLATAGDLAKSQSTIRTAFQSWPQGKTNITRIKLPAVPLKENKEEKITSVEHGVMVVMSFPVCGISEKDYKSLQLLAVIMGNGTGSRLYQHIREERQLTYHVGAQLSQNIGTNLLTLYAIGDEEQQDELRQAFITEWHKLHTNLPDEAELARAKGYLNGKLLYDSQSSSKIASQNALASHALLPGKQPYTAQDYRTVSLADLQHVIEYYCANYVLITIEAIAN